MREEPPWLVFAADTVSPPCADVCDVKGLSVDGQTLQSLLGPQRTRAEVEALPAVTTRLWCNDDGIATGARCVGGLGGWRGWLFGSRGPFISPGALATATGFGS